MSRSTRVATFCFTAVAVLVALLPLVRPLDDAVARALQITRNCDTDTSAERLGTIASAMLVVATVIVVRRPPPAAALIGAVLTFAAGALFGELLKTVFERLRPDSMPGVASGNAFPSGHIMNTTLAAVILWTLARPRERHRLERGALGVLVVAAVVVQALSRLWLGAHWASDVPASILLALGSVAVVPALLAERPLVFVGIAAAAAMVGFFFYLSPDLRPRLASPLDPAGEPILEIDVARQVDRARLAGDWELGHREPVGDVAWLRDDEGAIALPVPARPPAMLRIGIRPTTRGPARAPTCVTLATSVNDWQAPPSVLVTGWRELRVALPPDLWRAKGNELRFRVLMDEPTQRADFGLVGLRYLRLMD